MRRVSKMASNVPTRKAKWHNGVAKARTTHNATPSSKRARGGQRNERLPFAPPEDWHEPKNDGGDYRIVVQSPGEGYRHILTPDEIRARLSQLPKTFLQNLEVVQLSQMTRKKRSFPCYGMQWGTALYLYPLETSLVETFFTPPRPNIVNEARMYGGRWEHEAPSTWRLVWTEAAIHDFYLNNILIHELGHLVDDRNANYMDRERYAEWFAIQHGYSPSRASTGSPGRKKVVRRRHHARNPSAG